MTRAANQARTALLDTTALAATIDAALAALDTALAGWPTSTPGAAPAESGPLPEGVCDEHLGTGTVISGPEPRRVPLVCGRALPCAEHPTTATSIVERIAGTDRARSALDDLTEHTRQLAHHARAAATLALLWGSPALDKTAISRRIGEIDAGIWCVNCVRHGYRNNRIEGEQRCSFCGDFLRNWLRKEDGKGIEAPKEVLDLRSAKSRLYETDITRILARLGLEWKRPKRKKAA
jgi:hypothetical protein